MGYENRISVVITTKNRKYEVARAIRSVLNQTEAPYEIILVDDASNDGTKEFLNAQNLAGFRYIYNVESKGPGRSRNIGIVAATGNYVAFLDSDNEWFPNKIEECIKHIVQYEDADFVCAKYKMHYEFSTVIRPSFISDGDLTSNDEILVYNMADASATVYKKTFLEEVGGFSEKYISNIDWELLLRAREKKNVKFIKINDVLSENWVMFDSVSEQEEIETKERMLLFDKYKRDIFEKNLGSRVYKQYAAGLPDYLSDSQKRNIFFKKMQYRPEWVDCIYNQLVSEHAVITSMYMRKDSFYNMLSKWMEAKQRGVSLADVLVNEGIHKVAIYGYGRHGRLIYEELKNSTVTVSYIIDRNAERYIEESELPIYGLECKFPEIDAVIVSAYLEFDSIKSNIKEKLSAEIIPLDKLVNIANQMAKEVE